MDSMAHGDRTAIIETLDHLFVGTDHRDWKRVERCFAASVLFDMSSLGAGPPTSLTPSQITAAWDVALRPLDAIHHQTGNHLVEIDGTSAHAYCYGTASHFRRNESGRNTRTFVGSYDFDLVKEDGRWKVTTFKFNLKYIDGNLELEKS
jgi:hypothetical protein